MGMLSDRLTALVDALTGFEEGTVIAGFGSEPIEIFTKRVPADLYISIKDDGQTSVCQGDVNMVGYELMEDGFVLYPDVKTDSVEIDWVAIF